MKKVPLYITVFLFYSIANIVFYKIISNWYETQLLNMRQDPLVGWIMLLFVIYSFSLGYFAVCPAVHVRSIYAGAVRGAILGFATYAMFDFGTYSHFEGISLSFVAVNLTWGTLISAVSVAAAVSVGVALEPKVHPA
ncbi:DUF2177 family protein [Cognatiyoonia sp. IB215182]|uniref:DUF2177 family protein n=1 Tax=Cognatiyoonia sp. IB215182 TaxID=3097353 RepID=UPI002A1355D8|nr:DUF2177 family protein [Cognatiyoonia sp. IB215182]MDX8355335.1 DUF2177 family protein [Cognatiyoonia sp. IB215182]